MRFQSLHPSYEDRLANVFGNAQAKKEEPGRRKMSEAQARYFASEKGKAARQRAAKKQAEKRKRASGSFERKVMRELERVRSHIGPKLKAMGEDERRAAIATAMANGNDALIEALKREGY
jgi:hypothetical protein